MAHLYEIPHEGGELLMHGLTAGIKEKFVRWLKPRYILSAVQALEDAEAENKAAPGTFSEADIKRLQTTVILARQDANGGQLFWSAEPSAAVAAALATQAGAVKLARLMFPDSMAGWDDGKVWGYLTAVDGAGESHPYKVAFQLAWDDADPKAPRPADTSAGRTGTSGSTTTSAGPTSSASPPTPSTA
jgi:hypothetical protein